MLLEETENKICVVIGASHAGVNCAFALRKEGWEGRIILFDANPELPYHRPPLSKGYLTTKDGKDSVSLKPFQSYEKEHVELHLGVQVNQIDRKEKRIFYGAGSTQDYDTLVIATGASALIPPIPGLKSSQNMFPLRTMTDVLNIKTALGENKNQKVVVIGAGYIG